MDGTDRLLSEKEIIAKAEERFGIGAIKIKELLRDCEEIKAIPTNIAGEDMEKRINDTYNRRFEDKAETSA